MESSQRTSKSASEVALEAVRATSLAVFGSHGSFSEKAGLAYAEREGLDVELVHETEMGGVLRALEQRRADRGVLPVHNSIGGLVRGAFVAMSEHPFVPLDQLTLDVRHHLLVRSPAIRRAAIERVVSHPQALVQCARYLESRLPRAELAEWNDTASAARDLASGQLPPTTAVLASLRAATHFGLTVLEESVQDSSENRTTFIIVGRRHP